MEIREKEKHLTWLLTFLVSPACHDHSCIHPENKYKLGCLYKNNWSYDQQVLYHRLILSIEQSQTDDIFQIYWGLENR